MGCFYQDGFVAEGEFQVMVHTHSCCLIPVTEPGRPLITELWSRGQVSGALYVAFNPVINIIKHIHVCSQTAVVNVSRQTEEIISDQQISAFDWIV